MRAQCAEQPDSQLHSLFAEQKWEQVVRLAQASPRRSAEADFEYGLALAHLHRLAEAHRALLAARRLCPGDKRFPVELAGVAFEQKQYPEAARWLERALALDPTDEYANNFLGTVDFLTDNLPAALVAWNRVKKPYIAALDLDPHLRVHRLLLDRAFTFSPAAVLRAPQLAATEARLRMLGIFPADSLRLEALPNGQFNAVFRAQERDGFGATPLQALLSTFSGAPYETLYPGYFNLGRSAMNITALLRWDDQKRRAWVAVSAPLHEFPQQRWRIAADFRNENWAVRRSFTGTAPVLGSLNLQRQEITAGVQVLQGGALRWSLEGQLSHRTFRSVVDGSALTPALTHPGLELKALAGLDYRVLQLPQHRFTLQAGAVSRLGRMLSAPGNLFDDLQESAVAHWLPQMRGDRYELTQRVRGGRIFGTAPFDELYLFGMDRDDTDLWMRGHIATRDGRKGSAPIGNGYFLSNTDFLRRLYSNGLITLHAGPLLDIGRMAAPTSGLSTSHWLFDTGIAARISVLHTSVVLSYGRDLRSGANAFYGAAEPPLPLP